MSCRVLLRENFSKSKSKISKKLYNCIKPVFTQRQQTVTLSWKESPNQNVNGHIQFPLPRLLRAIDHPSTKRSWWMIHSATQGLPKSYTANLQIIFLKHFCFNFFFGKNTYRRPQHPRDECIWEYFVTPESCTHLQRNRYLGRYKSKSSTESAVQSNRCWWSSVVCINEVRQDTGITPTILKYFKWFLGIKRNLHQEEPAQKEKDADSRDMYVLHKYPSESKNARRKTRKSKEGTP